MEATLEERFAELDVKEKSTEECIREEKQRIRVSVWKTLEEQKNIREYPPCFGRIPNYKGSNYATDKVIKLREFRRANVIKINPSLAQMSLRHEVMKANKILIVPSPALASYDESQQDQNGNFFCYMLDGSKLTNKEKKQAMTKKGSIRLGTHLFDDWSSCKHIDIVVVGSVAVAYPSGRRLGKGLGFAEIEWATLYHLGIVDQSTVVITTVHENQIISDSTLYDGLQASYDLPVDIIVTPRRILNIRPKLLKPSCGILWDKLSEDQMNSISILRKLKPS